ncbi:MAG: class I SAM-dependent methyltransferase [Hyphomicrobiales bacterium]
MENNFYESIADWYDEIFPHTKMKENFVKRHINQETKNIVDIGCATGSLSLSISNSDNFVTGIDSDRVMIEKAQRKAYVGNSNCEFITADMLDTKELFLQNSQGAVICLGNTLVHLTSVERMQNFLNQAFYILKDGGKIIGQIINYDRILNERLDGLPTIDTDSLNFKRMYEYDDDSTLIHFHTYLTIKRSGKLIENNIPLYPLHKGELIKLLTFSGFKDIKLYGNMNDQEWSLKTQPTVFVASK